MAKVKLNPIIEQVSGGFGNLVFRRLGERVIIARKAGEQTDEPSEAQAAQRERFRQAVIYARTVLADAEARALYEQAAAHKGKPAFALSVADFLNPPCIDELDLSAYGGKVGDPIIVRARDDFGVSAVSVSLADGDGNQLESGQAAETSAGSGVWVYHAATLVATGNTVRISVSASDRAGGTGAGQAEKSL